MLGLDKTIGGIIASPTEQGEITQDKSPRTACMQPLLQHLFFAWGGRFHSGTLQVISTLALCSYRSFLIDLQDIPAII